MANPNAQPPRRPNPGDVNSTLGRVGQLLVKDFVRKDGVVLELIGDAAKEFNAALDANDAEALDLMMEQPAQLLLALVVALSTRIVALEARVTVLERH